MAASTSETSSEAASSTALQTLAMLPGPRGLPVLGNLLQIDQSRFHLTLESFWRAHGDVFTFRLGPTRCLGVADAELAKAILRKRPDDFRRMSAMESTARELGMHGVFSAEGEDWKRQRALIMPAFRDASLVRHFEQLRATTERLMVQLAAAADSGEPIAILDLLMRYTVDVMAQVAMGQDLNTLARGGNELQRRFETIFAMLLRRVLAPFPYWRYVKLPADRALDRALSAACDALVPLVDGTRRKLARYPELRAHPQTLLEAMLVAAADGEQRFTDEEVLANVFTLLLAGEDTTANTLAWVAYFLALHQDVQRELRAEVDATLGSNATLTNHAHVADLPLLTAVVHETLRLKGPAPFIALSAARDVMLGGIAVPARTPVFVLLRALAVSAPGVREPNRFDPNRWRSANSGAAAELARSSLPFGAGPRFAQVGSWPCLNAP